jgi:hypothetical protein
VRPYKVVEEELRDEKEAEAGVLGTGIWRRGLVATSALSTALKAKLWLFSIGRIPRYSVFKNS